MSTPEFSELHREIAVIGMSCRFPGAPSLAQFWNNLRDGVESMSSFSDEELLASGISKEVFSRPNYVRAGSVLEGIEEFDASFFGMSPREAEMTDPQQRLFLEVAWEGLEAAGYDPQRYDGSIGVFAGSTISTYLLFNLTPDVSIVGSGDHFPTLIGNDKDYLATHVSYKLNLRGPSMSIQTACSTSLVAIHMACQSLLDGECDMALAGGAAISVPQKSGYFFQEGAYFSPDGHCRSFAADARGTVFGSGVGVVVLKRLEDALRDGDCIDAVIKGSAINNDGAAKVGFTAPSVEGQARAISEALSLAEVEPSSIGYVETHGTATPLGDPIEIAALSLAYSGQDLPARSCAIGSVKSNVGHLDCAAGVAGFIKTVLSLKHAEIPPSLHCSTPNPEIDFDRTPFYVNSCLRPWSLAKSERRRAGVSSFGIGGTNAHVVLEEWPAATASPSTDTQATEPQVSFYPLALSARHPKALRDLVVAYRNLLLDLPEYASSQQLRDICYSATVRRADHATHRLFVVGRSTGQMVQQLDAFLSGELAPGLYYTPPGSRKNSNGPIPGVGFVFSGQGPQWWGMASELLERSAVFRQTIEELDRLFQRCQTNWRLWDELTAAEPESRLDGDQIEITQCALFAVQVGLARMWRAFGVEPSAAIGHSMGEVAAAAASGVLELEEAVRVIYERSRLLQRAVGKGMMAAVELGEAELVAELSGYGGTISVAAVNGRRASVVSGEPGAVASLLRDLERRGVMTRELRTTGVAGHSKQVDSVSKELVSVLNGVRGRTSKTTLISTVMGKRVENEEVDAKYWGRNLRECVRFAEGMREMVRLGPTVLIEMNAHPVLGLWIGEAAGGDGVVIATMRRDRPAWEMTLEGLGQAYVAGLEVNWREI
jgi:acyl transferase domain-containing protein